MCRTVGRVVKLTAAIIAAGLTVAAVTVAIFRVYREYDELDDGFDDIIAASYTSDPATWPRPIRFPS
jgi:hypothetical protein